jgi:hypothetical protein
MTALPNQFDRPSRRPARRPDRIIYTRHTLVDPAGDAFDRDEPALLLEGSWPPQMSLSHAQALDETIDARLDWIDQEAVRLARIVADVRPAASLDLISPARINELSLRYYLLKLIRVVAYFVEVFPLCPRQQVHLVAQPGGDDDYVDLIANLCRAASARCRVHWVGESFAAIPSFAANRPWRRGLGRIARLLGPRLADRRSPPGPRIVLCGNPRLLEPVGRELAHRTARLWWLYDRFAARSWLRWRPRGAGQLVCDSNLGVENRLRQPHIPPLVCRGIDLKDPVERWLAARLETHGARQTRIVEQIDYHFRRLRPQRLVLDEDATPLARAAVAVARRHGALSFVVQHGAPLSRFGFVPLWADQILAWGESSRRQFLRWGLSTESAQLVGSPRHRIERQGPGGPLKKREGWLGTNEVSPQSPRSPTRRVLLLSTVPPRDDRPDPVELHLTRNTYAEMLRVALASLVKIPNVRLVVKLHPRASSDPIARQTLAMFPAVPSRVVTRRNLETWLAQTDCVLSCASSGGVDAAVAGIPVIQLLPAGSGDVLPHRQWGFVGSARSEDQLDRLLNEALEYNPPRIGVFNQDVFEDYGHSAAAAVADAVLAQEDTILNDWPPQPNIPGFPSSSLGTSSFGVLNK